MSAPGTKESIRGQTCLLIAAIQSINNFCRFSIPHNVSYREWFDYPTGSASFPDRQTHRAGKESRKTDGV